MNNNHLCSLPIAPNDAQLQNCWCTCIKNMHATKCMNNINQIIFCEQLHLHVDGFQCLTLNHYQFMMPACTRILKFYRNWIHQLSKRCSIICDNIQWFTRKKKKERKKLSDSLERSKEILGGKNVARLLLCMPDVAQCPLKWDLVAGEGVKPIHPVQVIFLFLLLRTQDISLALLAWT
jgi:hypothetical protein